MSDPLEITFDFLATAKSPAAIELAIAALDSKYSAIQEKAVASLLRRGTTRSQTEVIRRIANLSARGRKLLDEQGPRLAGTLRQCLLHGDGELRATGLLIVTTAEHYDQVSTLLQVLEQQDDPFQESACQALQDLVNRLYEHSQSRKAAERAPRNLPQIRQAVLTALEGACNRFGSIAHAREVVECVLVLGDPENFAVRKVLLNSPPACREMAGYLLLTSKHPGVMRLVMEFMGQNYPVMKAMEAFEKRGDPEFVQHVLRSFPKRLSDNQQKSFKQLTRVAWIKDELVPLDQIPPALHEALSSFVQSTGLESTYKIEVQKWLMLHGSVQGRLAASQALEMLSPDSVRGYLCGGLESENEDVQAWATSQLRTQGVPEAIRLLMERLDSPLPAVRDAARGELESFNLELLLNIFDHLDKHVCQRAGALVRKTDPECNQKLLAELRNPIRRRRIRAARAAQVLGLAREVYTGLLAMLNDEDTLARRTAAEVLVSVPLPEVVTGFVELLGDSSPRVRETVEHSLDELRRMGVPIATAEKRPAAVEQRSAGGRA